MAVPGDIIHVCRRYRPDRIVALLDRRGITDCVTCEHQYGERVCPIVRTRFLRALGLETNKTQPEREAPK